MNQERLNVLYLSDDNYAIFAGVSMLSLLDNNKDIGQIYIYFIDDQISSDNKEKLNQIVQKYSRTLVFLDMQQGLKKLIELKAPKYRGSYTTYLKLFAFQLLPDDVKRILFIDSDTIVAGSLSGVCFQNLKHSFLAAVRDGLSSDYKMKLGFSQEESFFNMGVMLLDVTAWKESNCEAQIVAQMKKRSSYVAVDQDILNIAFKGKIETLSPQLNFTPHFYIYRFDDFMKVFKQGGFYAKEEMQLAKKKPIIIHFERFIGESPWHKKSVHPFVKQFDYYLKKTPWKDYEKKKAKKDIKLKIEKILYLILPHRFFLLLFSVAYKSYLQNTFKNLSDSKVQNIKV